MTGIGYCVGALRRLKKDLHLARMRRRWWGRNNTVEGFMGYTVRILDGASFYMQYKDEFVNRIYHFDCGRKDPLIIDGGSNIGMSILYFKRAYPGCRVIGFEPDPAVFRVLEENVRRNGLTGVTLRNSGLGGRAGRASFTPDGSDGGKFGGAGAAEMSVETVSAYLAEPVDLLKLNIEGEELSVLEEAERSGRLGNAERIILEYHGWAKGPQRLGELLGLLERNGYRYMVHDFDSETNPATKPPFGDAHAAWFCLVYGQRR